MQVPYASKCRKAMFLACMHFEKALSEQHSPNGIRPRSLSRRPKLEEVGSGMRFVESADGGRFGLEEADQLHVYARRTGRSLKCLCGVRLSRVNGLCT